MLDRIFPKVFDNVFRGNIVALVLFFPLVLLHLLIAVAGIVRSDGAMHADGIPSDTYSHAAANAVIGVGAYLDLADLWLGLFFLLAGLRYRAMIPMMYAVMVADFIAHRGIGVLKPIVRAAGTADGLYVTWGLFAFSVIGLILSLTGKRYRAMQQPAVT